MTFQDARERAEGPGKFEGEAPHVPIIYDMVLDGFADETYTFNDAAQCTLDVVKGLSLLDMPDDTPEDYPLPETVYLYSDEVGFVHELDKAQADAIIAQWIADQEDF